MSDPVPAARERLASLCKACGIRIPELYLPAPAIDLTRFAVVACDQFTSEPEYWAETARIADGVPSALNLILPEYFLEHPGDRPVDARIRSINAAMNAYLEQGILLPAGAAAVVLQRATPGRSGRLGLVLAIDLDQYDFTPGNRQLIRATEGTVLDRIPPRVAIRRDAPLELPHVQLLIDDPGRTVIEPLFAAARVGQAIYDFELMQGGGHLTGYRAAAGDPALQTALECLARLESLHRDGLLFAVGDGNHSLATAKAHYERIKAETGPGAAGDHPARFALVEVINIHDAGLEFEPIHRAVFDIAPDAFRTAADAFFGTGTVVEEATAEHAGSLPEAEILPDGSLILPLLQSDGRRALRIAIPGQPLAADVVTRFLDTLVQGQGARIDYIHGAAAVAGLAAQGATGILLPPIDKGSFFAAIARDGILPRKTFSMGEAHEKRYYLEARKII